MVDMNERAADVRQHFDLVLQILGKVVCLPERRVRTHHDIDFDVIIRSALCAHAGISTHGREM